MAQILRRFSEAELRAAVYRELPELLADLPGPGASFRDVAFALVRAAKSRGYVPDLEILIASRKRPAAGLRAALVGVLVLVGAGAVFMAGRAVPAAPSDSQTSVEAAAPMHVEPPPTSPVAGPEPRPAAVPVSTARSPRTRRKEAVAPEPKSAPVPTASPEHDETREPASGRADCRGWSCRLSADSGQFHHSEEFCVVPAAGAEMKRCIIHGELLYPASTVECDLSEARLTGEMRWQRCRGEL
ncbi:hypothetical protein SAMN02745121_01408 [Nannocystis exedens]|uniref:Uncharacterized protein n=1 Tax=Nannocystis exedens TaxID=54 RepID=A0A1I1V656_9BACT|nr:hypothetical protein [Nannocystis exedens]PCC72199.1 hypothetical protein NAEX_05278 [Nannocystis exedens]SFD75820.1 hypothetical protein SAMN02745121_01408 [Nannocystis exedens]